MSTSKADPGLAGAHVVLGVTGGIAAYKAVYLARLLVQSGAHVDTVLTHGATQFVGAATFTGVTGRSAHTGVWDAPETVAGSDAGEGHLAAPHIQLARRADVIVVAPATAHSVARAATGFADDLLTNVLLMARCPVVVAPAMHTEMWEHEATRHNIETLRARGVEIVGPARGELAGGDVGEGRMVEPEEILESVREVLGRSRELVGRTVVVTAGPTREAIDPVRFIGNRSSGRMGFALAEEAARRGAVVHLVAGPVDLTTPPGVERHDVVSARDMHERVFKLVEDADVVVKAAAVADFRPTSQVTSKIKKDQGTPQVTLEPNPDILADLGARREGGHPVLVGFAAETDDPEGYGRRKLEAKGVDLMVVNDVSSDDAGFEVDTNRVLILGRGGQRIDVPLATKPEIAKRVWDEIAPLLG